jgi:hypothetical protein
MKSKIVLHCLLGTAFILVSGIVTASAVKLPSTPAYVILATHSIASAVQTQPINEQRN